LTIRPATAADARKLAEVHVASWKAGYEGLVPDWYLARQSVDKRHAQWQEILANASSTVLVAGEIDGFIAFEPETGEIPVLYVAPASFGQGIGTRLLQAAHAALDRDTALWVFAGNERALRFYARHGYQPDGATQVHEPTGLTEVRMTRQTRE
jgi:GNAT superfamily N-acetyltransferase